MKFAQPFSLTMVHLAPFGIIPVHTSSGPKFEITSMYSSRRRTARLLTIFRSIRGGLSA